MQDAASGPYYEFTKHKIFCESECFKKLWFSYCTAVRLGEPV